MNDQAEGYNYPQEVRFELLEKDIDSYRRAADYLNFNNTGVLCVQHEFGIYGGPAGSHLLALLKEVRMPVVTTLHTVLREPGTAQRKVMDEIIRRSDRLVVMARKGAEILQETYGAPKSKIHVIPHGIPDVPFGGTEAAKAQFGIAGRTVLLTFGLIGPGKGIETAIQALPGIVRRHPEALYIVLGATHPHLLAREGERYRSSLEWLAEENGVKDHVIFDNRFVSPGDLQEFISATDIYVTPYLNREQITSGTLAQVFGAGRAVVSTHYWHAEELLAEGRGILVPFSQPEAITGAVCEYLERPGLMLRTQKAAWHAGREMIWSAVAKQYMEVFQHARADYRVPSRTAFAGWTVGHKAELPRLKLDHLRHMTDSTGIFQHALYTVPDFQHGYCTDDNARGFILCCLRDNIGGSQPVGALDDLSTSYLAFLSAALDRESGRFRNFMSFDRQWLETAGSEDSHGRGIWAAGLGAARARNEGHRALCAQIFDVGLASVEGFTSPRAWAFTLLGIHEYLSQFPDNSAAKAAREVLTGDLLRLWKGCASDDWPWFEPGATYDNARLSQALMISGQALQNEEALDAGLKSLTWLVSIQKTPNGSFRPIGSEGFCIRDGARAHFDQQPVEAQAMVSACVTAYQLTNDAVWSREARRAFEWFLGRNDLGLPLYDAATGGCADGLHPDRVNQNQGAESTLAFHIALAEMTLAQYPLPARV
ncbi:glycosyltransferase family 4 protein [Brevifollis gellanilyticus]|uniref:glycosyltransferase family 4 protein n=1 Tax=Brevifollis gellanilyticus TaxID=748831 RepID=UPI001FEAFB7D|nr:glycosyltransferase family 4 protein [Brevifollis gellanilyticus]